MLLTYKKADSSPMTVRLKTISQAKPVTIGRSKDANVTLDDPKCSRIHTAIRYWDDIFIVRDMGSRNGTFVNDEKIEVAKLNPGDILKVGDTELKVLAEGTKSDITIVSDAGE